MSLCMPRSCGDKDIYTKLMATMQYKGNNIVELVKKLIDFNNLHDIVPLELDQDLLR